MSSTDHPTPEPRLHCCTSPRHTTAFRSTLIVEPPAACSYTAPFLLSQPGLCNGEGFSVIPAVCISAAFLRSSPRTAYCLYCTAFVFRTTLLAARDELASCKFASGQLPGRTYCLPLFSVSFPMYGVEASFLPLNCSGEKHAGGMLALPCFMCSPQRACIRSRMLCDVRLATRP